MQVLTLNQVEYEHAIQTYAGRILRAVIFCDACKSIDNSFLTSIVAMPPLSDKQYELWIAPENQAVQYTKTPDFDVSECADMAIMRITAPVIGGKGLEEAAYTAYQTVFAQVEARGMNLLRVHHYIPEILSHVDGLENYRWHNIGRERAWHDFGPWNNDEPILPAATGIGAHDGPYVLEAVLTKYEVIALQNPRQIPFHNYGKQYGPKPPFCARGVLHRAPWGDEVWISGTASIRGHESQWHGDVPEQVKETFRNISALVGESNLAPYNSTGFALENLTQCRAYIKQPEAAAQVEEALVHLIPGKTWISAHTDVCRQELEFEFEAIAQ